MYVLATQDGRLQVGDQIVEINGESVAHLSHSDVVAKVKTLGQGGAPIQLGVARMEQAMLGAIAKSTALVHSLHPKVTGTE